MRKILSWIVAALRAVFSRDTAEAIGHGIEAALPYVQAAYELVRLAAAMTPTRADDELIALCDALGVPRLWSQDDRGQAIASIVIAALRKRYGDVPERVLRRALEIAYGAIKP